MSEQPKQATHEELCDAALQHYMELSDEVCRYLSTVPQAIEFYKVYGECLVKLGPTEPESKEDKTYVPFSQRYGFKKNEKSQS